MEWFTRKYKPEYIQLPKNDNDNMIVSSSESFAFYHKDPTLGTTPTYNVQYETRFWLKDAQYSLVDMLGGVEMGLEFFIKETFAGGTVYQAFLNPWCCHRWTSPISGTIKHSYRLAGTYYIPN